MVNLTPMPPSIAALPRDERGYPVPWFVAWVDGKPEFRCAEGGKLALAIRRKLCWVCGEPRLPNQLAFVIGPMCTVNCTTAEPPCHPKCAEFSVMNCPFLTKPKAVRRDANMPQGTREAAGISIPRNPGVTCLYYCQGYQIFEAGNGLLFKLPSPPRKVAWYREGRAATRAEIMESIETGLPILAKMANEEGPEAMTELSRMVEIAEKLLPAA